MSRGLPVTSSSVHTAPHALVRSTLGLLAGLVAIAAGPSVAHAQVACRYEVAAVIQAPPGGLGAASATSATAISPNGRYIVGHYTRPFIVDDPRAFCYDMQTGQFISLPLPANGWQSYANDVSDAGIVVGSYWVTGGVMPQRGYLFDLASNSYIAELLPHPGASWCSVTGINASGKVCGTRSIGSKGSTVNPQTAFIWSANSGYTDLGLINGFGTAAHDINDLGQVAIADSIIAGTVAGLWTGTQFIPTPPMPDGSTPFPRRINNLGAIAGTASLGASTSQPFVWLGGRVDLLGTLPGANRGGSGGITSEGTVTGLNTLIGGGQRAYVWAHNEMRDLTALVNQPGFILTRGMGISENGIIIADAPSSTCAVLSPVLPRLGDTNCDAIVNVADLLAVIMNWGPCENCVQDMNHDGQVEHQDLLIVIMNWGAAGVAL